MYLSPSQGLTPLRTRSATDLERLRKDATVFLASNQLGKRCPNIETAVLLMAKAESLGMPAIEGLSQLYCINGVVAIQGQGMLAQIHRSGRVRVVIEEDKGWCRCTMTRTDTGSSFTTSWDAQRVAETGVGNGKETYKRYSQQMMRWRAVSECARIVAPDIIGGLYTPEEFGVSTLDELTPEVVASALSPVSEPIGEERGDALKQAVGDAAKAGADKDKLRDGFQSIFTAQCVSHWKDLSADGEAAIRRLIEKLSPGAGDDTDPFGEAIDGELEAAADAEPVPSAMDAIREEAALKAEAAEADRRQAAEGTSRRLLVEDDA